MVVPEAMQEFSSAQFPGFPALGTGGGILKPVLACATAGGVAGANRHPRKCVASTSEMRVTSS